NVNSILLINSHSRFKAIRNPGAYEKESVNYLFIFTATFLAAIYAVGIVYLIYWQWKYWETIIMMYCIEATVISISIILLFYSKQRLLNLPYTSDRVNAKYQIEEIFEFSRAILPSLLISSLLKSAALIPTVLWQGGFISYELCCLFYFTTHSLNCILMKITLIVFHKTLRRNLQKLPHIFRGRITPESLTKANKEDETQAYFNQIRESW
ncbi:hypothetical protein PFISCL1PPCAC_714, partial [Pristionchus fissidentatus]